MSLFSLPSGERKLYRSDTIVFECAVSQQKEAFDITGYSIWFTAKPQISLPDGGVGVIQKTIGSGITVLDAPQSIVCYNFNN